MMMNPEQHVDTIHIMDDNQDDTNSNVNVPIYERVTDVNNIPYEEETRPYTENSIANQKRKLVKDALNHGLKLKAID